MQAVLKTLLRLPAFLYGVGCLFWCFEGAVLTGFLKWWKLWGPRNDCQAVLCFLKFAFRYKAVRLGEQKPITDRKVVFLCNHRGWADFFVDMWVVGARARPLSRLAVGMAFPAFTSSLVAIKSILLFNRAGIKDTEKFNAWLDGELAQPPQNSLLVYPEGTRSLKQASLPLKRGMLRYTFSRKLPVQVIITPGKEQVLNERRKWAHFGRTLIIGCSEVLESSGFEDFEEFMSAVQALWDAEWDLVHAATPKGLPELVPSFPDLHYPPAMLAIESAALAGWTAVLAAGAYATVKVGLAVAAAPGGPALLAALGVWTAASMTAATLLPAPATRGGARSGAAGGDGSSGAGAGVKQE